MSDTHYLDDYDWEIEPTDEPTGLAFFSVALLLISLFLIGAKAFETYTRPPVVVFHAPVPPNMTSQMPLNQSMYCTGTVGNLTTCYYEGRDWERR